MGVHTRLPLLTLWALLWLTCGVVQASIGMGQIRSGLESLASSLAPMYLPVSVSPSSPCGRALQDMAASLASNSSWWAANMVDSWGKALDGLGMGNIHYYGNFDQCVYAGSDDLTGKFCTIETYLMSGERKSRLPKPRPWRPDSPWARDILNRDPRTAPTSLPVVDGLLYSTCMPSVCTKQELQDSLSKVLWPQGVWPIVTYCTVLNPPAEFTNPDIGFTALLTFLVVFVVCASLIDMYLTYTGNQRLSKVSQTGSGILGHHEVFKKEAFTTPEGPLRYLLVFSAYTNLGKILQVNPSSTPGTISCLHAMRVLSMIWVIYCHQITVPFGYMVNIFSFLTAFEGFLGQVILNGYPSVDTFFFLSGLLVSYSVLRAAKKTGGRFNLPVFYLHRIIRLLPPISIVVGLVTTVMRFLISGPIAIYWGFWYNICRDNWWKDILFVSNILTETGDCIGQVWYLGVDMQLYLVAPIIIFPLYWYKRRGEVWLFLVTVLSCIIPAAITYAYNMPPAMLQGQGNTTEAFLKRYLTPWCRASPWLVGVWLGYLFFRQGNVRYRMSPVAVLVGWSLASLTGFLVVFGMYSYNNLIGVMPFDVVTQISYSGLHRLAWGAALAWVVFACHNGYGGVVNDFLSHPVWQPISRLTYTTYLVALPLQYVLFDNTRKAYYFTHLNVVISTVGTVFLSVIGAALVSLVAESPVVGLEKLLLKPGGGAAKKNTSNAKKDALDAPTSSQPAACTTATKPPQNGAVFIVEADVREDAKPAGVTTSL